MPDVIRANVYDSKKNVLWSTDKTLIGRQFTDNDELDEALRGELVMETGKDEDKPHPKSEHEHIAAATPFVENYVPIHAQDRGEIIGVVEFYREPGALFATIVEGNRLIWGASIAGGLLLYVILFWTVRRADLIMRQQQQRIVDSETMATLGELASMVAHNVRNPIASIRSTAELAQTFGALEKTGAADIIADVDRIEHSLRQVLAYATPGTASAARSCANELLRATASSLPVRKNVTVELSLQEPLPFVKVDPVLLGQALKSIVTNALDAMPLGGKLYLRTCTIAQGKVEVCIADTGEGIPRHALAQVFNAFFTTKPKGMGLGLSLARSIVRRYDGEIDIQSEPHRGTAVFLRLHAS
jgi:signal transduction histidine kinase